MTSFDPVWGVKAGYARAALPRTLAPQLFSLYTHTQSTVRSVREAPARRPSTDASVPADESVTEIQNLVELLDHDDTLHGRRSTCRWTPRNSPRSRLRSPRIPPRAHPSRGSSRRSRQRRAAVPRQCPSPRQPLSSSPSPPPSRPSPPPTESPSPPPTARALPFPPWTTRRATWCASRRHRSRSAPREESSSARRWATGDASWSSARPKGSRRTRYDPSTSGVSCASTSATATTPHTS